MYTIFRKKNPKNLDKVLKKMYFFQKKSGIFYQLSILNII